ncbi:MAG: HD-GYP domain-containing protein [bacterium]
MTHAVRANELEIGNHIIEAYDQKKRLLLRNYWIHNEKDLQRLKELNVFHAIIAGGKSINIPPKKTIPAEKIGKSINDAETKIEETQILYHNTIEQIKDIFTHVKEKIPVEPQKLLPFVNNMIDYASGSPASLAFLTQIGEYDFDTFRHSVNVGILTLLYLQYHNRPHREIVEFTYGAMLHDIGKIFIPDSIITKHDRLSEDEYKIVKKHPEWGYETLKEMNVDSKLLSIAYEHHERPDGSGYPEGKIKIDPISRVISVFDVYDALTSKRVYKERITPNRAFLSLTKEFGDFPETKQIVHDLLRCIGLYPVGSLVRLTNGEIGVVHKNHPRDLKHPVVCIIFDDSENEINRPFLVDLQQIQAHKSLYNDRLYDDDVEIREVVSVDHVDQIADDDIFSTFDRLEKRTHKTL